MPDQVTDGIRLTPADRRRLLQRARWIAVNSPMRQFWFPAVPWDESSRRREVVVGIGDPGPESPTPATVNCFLPPNGAPIKATVREIDHPHGRFERRDGTRFDVCIMEIKTDPAISAPSAEVFANYHTGNRLAGERSVDDKITIGRKTGQVMPRIGISFHQAARMIRRCALEAEEFGCALTRLASAAPAARRDRSLVLRGSSPGGQV